MREGTAAEGWTKRKMRRVKSHSQVERSQRPPRLKTKKTERRNDDEYSHLKSQIPCFFNKAVMLFCLLLKYYQENPQLGVCTLPASVDRQGWLQMLETSRLPQWLQHPALTVAAWMKRLPHAPREALKCTEGFG